LTLKNARVPRRPMMAAWDHALGDKRNFRSRYARQRRAAVVVAAVSSGEGWRATRCRRPKRPANPQPGCPDSLTSAAKIRNRAETVKRTGREAGSCPRSACRILPARKEKREQQAVAASRRSMPTPGRVAEFRSPGCWTGRGIDEFMLG
jgi:hypothetical protein